MAQEYPFTVAGICQRVSARLGDNVVDPDDDSDSAWDKCLIQTSVRDVLATISIFRPDLFTKEIDLPLEAGVCGQLLPEECPRLSGYVCVKSSNGDEIPVSIGDFRINHQIRSYPKVRQLCKEQPDDRLLNIAEFKIGVSPVNTRRFNISPTPPEGYTYTLIAECVELGDFTDNENQELPSEVRPWLIPIVEMVMYMMLSIDSADPSAQIRAQMHLGTFSQLSSLNLQGLQDVIQTLTSARLDSSDGN